MTVPNRLTVLALALVSGLAAANPPRNGGLPVPANHIVGSWEFNVSVGPCGAAPVNNFKGFSLYHAGGTLSDTNTAPPSTRGPGIGVWEHVGDNLYRSRFRFARFNPTTGAFLGMQDVRQDVVLGAGNNTAESVIDARTFDVAGNLVVQGCGTAVGQRIGID